ncbi:Ig-like domain-containing protein [Putridiphycobacter roseus]|nr:Ig-like domain-containing protein [Putridiphycobacter roseus]
MKTTQIIIITLLSLFTVMACQKKKNNQSPTIHFIAPQNNLVIEQDTILSIIVEPHDAEEKIKKVELLLNGVLIKTFDAPPYQYDWQDAKMYNEGTFKFSTIAYDNKGATGQEEINVAIKDYRTKYLGDFNFRIIRESWMDGEQTTYDTSFYTGEIRRYEFTDSENDLYSDYDGEENPNEKITIAFEQNTKITSLLHKDGSLITKSGYHYQHKGGFFDMDEITFRIDNLGGLGAGWNYDIVGIRE